MKKIQERLMGRFIVFFIAVMFTFSLHAQDGKLRLAVLPDTQSYLESCPDIMKQQFEWLAENSENFDYVLHVGDITQGNTHAEWALSKIYFDKINDKIPYAIALGNHDMGSAPNKFADVRNSSLANKYFPKDELKKYSSVQGSFEADKIDNTYHTFNKGANKWLILSLEFGPRNEVLDWANGIVSNHPEHLVILITHAYMYVGEKRQAEGDDWRAHGYGIGKDTGKKGVNDGEEIWEKLVRKHPNFFMVFSGHVLHEGLGQLVSEGDHGNKVYQFLANYQRGVKGYGDGCNGFLRLVEIDLGKKSLITTTYSPYLNEWLNDSANDFKINLSDKGEK